MAASPEVSSAPGDGAFFIMGAARSGTTLLRLMLNRHPRLAIPPESHFLIPLMDEMPLEEPLMPDQARRAAEILTTHPRFRTWHIESSALARAFVERAPCPLRELIDTAFRLEVRRTGKPRWGDKTPGYAVCWDKLDRVFPRARMIHLLRDGRDVMVSLARVGWHGLSDYGRTRYWCSRVEMARRCQDRLGTERCLVCHYEDLVLDPSGTLACICAFLGEDYDERMLDFHRDAFDHLNDFDGRVEEVHGKLARPPDPRDVERWRRELPDWRLVLFESIAGRALELSGHPRHATSRLAWVRWPYGALAAPPELFHAAWRRLKYQILGRF